MFANVKCIRQIVVYKSQLADLETYQNYIPEQRSSHCGCPCKYVDQKGLADLIKSAGLAPEMNQKITQKRKHARDPPWQMSSEVDNRGIRGPFKKDLYPTKNYFLKKLHYYHFVVTKKSTNTN